ncbi:hypothetical protein [Fervidibacillus halotolerans]|uniref:Uncharacterized protein n=1 Tax=Fervidibacillus halotolerans TaxID=2980027 RepID=A0A9E8LY86_9BACI|nr:hypothetical protein [Fervidibacillus halotolerans]WAA11766.1 hypothetical protein OE105_09050 [Fervidibacillus halotolerans]
MMDMMDYYRQQPFSQSPYLQQIPGGYDGAILPGVQGAFPGGPGFSNQLERLERRVNRLDRRVDRLEKQMNQLDRRLRRVERQLGY